MKYHKIIDIGHQIMANYLTDKSICVDLTLGNGYDSLFLLQKATHLYGFDIQPQSLINTRVLLDKHHISPQKYQLFCDNHSLLLKYLPENIKIDLAVFNLGYLPQSDKKIMTDAQSTLTALKNLLPLMAKNSLILLTCYKHLEGQLEYLSLKNYLQSLDLKKYNIFIFEYLNKPLSPSIIGLEIN